MPRKSSNRLIVWSREHGNTTGEASSSAPDQQTRNYCVAQSDIQQIDSYSDKGGLNLDDNLIPDSEGHVEGFSSRSILGDEANISDLFDQVRLP
jgi:hypothetical protein